MDLGKIMKKRVLSLSVYQLAILIALIAMLFFFSDSSLLKRLKYENEIRDLKTQIEYYRKQTETDRAKLNELQSSLENLEKYARENYLMKKENEEIFVIE
jgi:cell division protein DivIC